LIKPLITIVTVVYNGDETLERTIKSVINQTYKNIEYIIIDGNSTDKTLNIIKKYNSKIDYWVSESDKGIYDAMNKGVKFARGEYIQFLNSGDYLVENRVLNKVAKELLKNYPEILYGQNKMLSGLWPVKDIISRVNKGYETLPHQSTFMKRDLILGIGLFNTKYSISGDRDLIYRSLKTNPKTIFIKIPISFFDHNGASSRLHFRQSWKVDYINFGFKSALHNFVKGILINIPLRFLSFLGILNLIKKIKAKFQN
jgi:glycosyltransferase involved in cell wall biosynthesis